MFDEQSVLSLLRNENERLKALLREHGISYAREINSTPDSSMTTTDKVALFRKLFRGRDDVYALRWQSKEGRSGYSPACAHEWERGICIKPSGKCAACAYRSLLPLTDQVIFDHCAGKHVVGLYPLQMDDTCRLLAIDFDDNDWRDDARAFIDTCREMNVTCSLEISRSGKGAHVWIFFSSDIQAGIARQLGSALISRTCAKRRQLSLKSYDRFFPNQDHMPSGGFGNLIALPLQKNAREHGTTIFVDDDLQPFPDQWAYLSSIVPIDVNTVDAITHWATEGQHPLDVSFLGEDADDPWKMNTLPKKVQGALPKAIEVVFSDRLYIAKTQLPQPLLNRIVRIAAFPNPEFYKAQSLRLSVWDKPRIIGCAENFPHHIALPRGCLNDLENLLHENNVELQLKHERSNGKPIAISFTGALRPEQESAVDAMIKHEHGVLNAPTAFGKTVVAAALIARRGVNTLVLVHRRELQQQWKERLKTFLNLEVPGVGTIGGGVNHPGGIIDVAVFQSLIHRANLRSFLETYGQIIIDECHHVSAISFECIMKQCSSRYIVGLSATPVRRDGLAPIIFMQCGPIRYSGARSTILAENMEVRLSTLAYPAIPKGTSIQSLFKILSESESLNKHICMDIISAFREGRKIIALTERNEHLSILHTLLEPSIPDLFVLHGRMSIKQRTQVIERLNELPESDAFVILATGRLVGEGFDHANLDTLVLAMPISWKGTLQQYAGRLNRDSPSKCDLRIYDYIECGDTRLSHMWAKRERGYRALGYRIARRDLAEEKK